MPAAKPSTPSMRLIQIDGVAKGVGQSLDPEVKEIEDHPAGQLNPYFGPGPDPPPVVDEPQKTDQGAAQGQTQSQLEGDPPGRTEQDLVDGQGYEKGDQHGQAPGRGHRLGMELASVVRQVQKPLPSVEPDQKRRQDETQAKGQGKEQKVSQFFFLKRLSAASRPKRRPRIRSAGHNSGPRRR